MRVGFIFLCILLGLIACTKDDICSEDTPTTPLLVIEFRDINNRLNAKEVSDLLIRLNDAEETVVQQSVNDTIVNLPLDLNASSTEYSFILNGSDTLNFNTDVIQFNYEREDIYINRACAFKSVYRDFIVDLSEEINTNWILDFEILQPSIEDETSPHLTIYH